MIPGGHEAEQAEQQPTTNSRPPPTTPPPTIPPPHLHSQANKVKKLRGLSRPSNKVSSLSSNIL